MESKKVMMWEAIRDSRKLKYFNNECDDELKGSLLAPLPITKNILYADETFFKISLSFFK